MAEIINLADRRAGHRDDSEHSGAVGLSEDAAILSVCAAFTALEHRKAALLETIHNHTKRYLAIRALRVQQDLMVTRLAKLHSSSLGAQLARGQVLRLLSATQYEEEDAWASRLIPAIMRDLL